jgi:hypothetical protein
MQRICAIGKPPRKSFKRGKNNVSLDKNRLQVARGKTKVSIRRARLSDSAKSILKPRINRFDDSFLFPQNDKDGSPPTKALDSFHRQAIDKLGFRFRLFDCRHTFAPRVLENGTD